jgi:prepilin-type N-terminal cleavage/methylation domain-containing protein
MTIDAYKQHKYGHRGFTLPEAMLAMVILAMAAAGVLLPFASGASVQAEGMHRSLAAGLANDLLERIIRTPFDDIVGTWHGYAEAQGQVKNASGNTFTDPIYANYSREVTCAWDPDQDFFILVTVRVSYLGRQIAVVNRLISE